MSNTIPQIYFYLEPYVYVNVGKNGILLINLIDDYSFVCNDTDSVRVIKELIASPSKTLLISFEERNIPVIATAVKKFMGDIVYSTGTPLQFSTEINNIHSLDAYRKSIIHSKYNIGNFISECNIILDSSNSDSHDFIACKTGVKSIAQDFSNNNLCKIDVGNLKSYYNSLLRINPHIRFNICCASATDIRDIYSTLHTENITFYFSQRILENNPEIKEIIQKHNINYVVIMHSYPKSFEVLTNKPRSLWYQMKCLDDCERFTSCNRLNIDVKPCPILTTSNAEFIQSLLSISESELLSIKNKYRIIKANNLINSSLIGSIFVFSDDYIYLSLLNKENRISLKSFFEVYKESFFSGNFDWCNIRSYKECQSCIFRYLCPSPTYIEKYLRDAGTLKCLMNS